MKFKVIQKEGDTFTLPHNLSAICTISNNDVIKTRTFDISNGGMDGMSGMGALGNSAMMKEMHQINNKVYDQSRIDEFVQSGTTVIGVFDNSKGTEPHPMHIHALQFQVLDRTGWRNN